MRDTPREREFARKSIPSAIALNPSELLVGIDDDHSATDLADYIRSIGGDFEGLRIVTVPRSTEWQFSLANVVWNCYKACNHDAVLGFDVDTILRPAVMKGRYLVGRESVAVVSFTKRLFCRTVGDYVRYATYRLAVRRSSYVFAGTYWVWRPYYFAAVDRNGFSKIANGVDGYMLYAINRDGRYVVLTLKDIGAKSLDYENEFYPWRQFADGVYWGANCRNSTVHRALGIANVIYKSATYNKWGTLRGYWWGLRNYNSSACQAARRAADVNEWGMQGGSRYFKDRDWSRRGTGYA